MQGRRWLSRKEYNSLVRQRRILDGCIVLNWDFKPAATGEKKEKPAEVVDLTNRLTTGRNLVKI